MINFFHQKYFIYFMSLFFFAFSGCSNPLGGTKSYVDPNFGQSSPHPPSPSGYETVSGSKLMQTTGNGHSVDVTIGAPTSALRIKTNKNRTAYISVQGQMVSN